MKVYIIMENWTGNGNIPTIYGVFSTEEKAEYAYELAKKNHDNNFTFYIIERKLDLHCENNDTLEISFQERLEALEQYMAVAQRKIMALQNAVNTLLFISELEDEKAREFMNDVMNNFGRNK